MRIVLSMFVLACVAVAQSAAPPSPERVTIDRAVREALDHNLNLLAERYNLSIADARIATAKLRPNPVFSAAVDYLDFLGKFTPNNGAGPTEYNARTDFVLERGRKRELRVEVAQNAKEVARLQLQNTARSLTFDVQNAFVEALAARDNLQLARENLSYFRGIVDVNQSRVSAGDLSKVELVRTQVAALQFETAVRQGEARLKQAQIKLQSLMGRSAASDSFDVEGDLRRDSAPLTLVSIQGDALQLRPDLLATRKDQARSQAELRSQIAQGKVDFTIGTEFHRQFYNGSGDALGVFFSAPLPIFNRNQGEIERARREAQQVEARIKALEADIQGDVNAAWVQYSTSRNLLESIEGGLLGQAKQVRDTMEYSYRRGEASLVEFLDAQRAFNDARQSYNEARADYARSLYLIDSISGKSVQ